MWITMNKISTVIFWLLAMVSYVQEWEGVLSYLPLVALVVAAVHVLEVIFFWVSLKDNSDNPKKDALFIMIFGIFHLQQFMKKAS